MGYTLKSANRIANTHLTFDLSYSQDVKATWSDMGHPSTNKCDLMV